ncbi:hypothetical protein ACQ4PT_018870 [Festuca glaucescens]
MARATAAQLVVVALVAAMILASPRTANAIPCGQVTGDFVIFCIKYARDPPLDDPPSSRCCSSVKGIAAAARSAKEKLTACRCFQSMLKGIRGINPEAAASIPSKCGVSFPFAISTSVPCPDFWLMNRSTTHGVNVA